MNSVFKLSNIFMILLGNAAMALGIVMFILPNGLMTGGTTGLSLIVGHYTSLPISAFVFLFNAVMFILGLVVLGRAFAMTTLLSTFFYPVALGVFPAHPGCRGRDHRRQAPVQSLWRAVHRICPGHRDPGGSVHGRDGYPAADPE